MKIPLLLCLTTMGPLSAALANDDALSRCRALQDDRARLTCYDAIVLPVAASAPSLAAKPPPATGAAATTAAPVAPAVAAPAAASFGLERQAAEAALEEIRSTIPGQFKGWDAQTRFRLANGQLWAVADGSRAAYGLTDPPVRITRGMLGGFRMEIEGVAQLLRVRRLE